MHRPHTATYKIRDDIKARTTERKFKIRIAMQTADGDLFVR